MSKELKVLGTIGLFVAFIAIIGYLLYDTSPPPATLKPGENEALVRSDSPALGAKDAEVEVVEFVDPECESCATLHPIMKQILKDYDGKVRLVVRYMPLHPNSMPAANFLEAAGEQGKYWEAQDLLFSKQPEWGTKHGQPASAPTPDLNALFRKYAEELKLNADQVMTAISDNKFKEKIVRDQKDGESLGVRQTPTIFVNGTKLLTLSEPALTYLIDQEIKKKQ